MSEDGLKIVEDYASFITVAKTKNVRVLNLITFKDYWHGGTWGNPSLTFVRCSQRDAGLSQLE